MKKNKNLLPRARELRKEMTPYERKLWYEFLKDYPVKIYKQRIIGNFIVDFYCHKAKLVIELDGKWHYEKESSEHDIHRENILKSYGLEIIRFSNNEVENDFRNVCDIIDGVIRDRYDIAKK